MKIEIASMNNYENGNCNMLNYEKKLQVCIIVKIETASMQLCMKLCLTMKIETMKMKIEIARMFSYENGN